MDAIDRILQTIFSENQILDQDARDMFTLFRETVKADMVRDYIKQIGFQSSFDIPFPKDIDINNAFDLYNYVTNKKLKFENFKKYVVDQAKKHLEDRGDMGYGDTGMGGSDTYGGEQPSDEFGGSDTGGTDQEFDQMDQSTTEPEGGEVEPTGPEETGGSEPQEPQDMNFDETPPPPSF